MASLMGSKPKVQLRRPDLKKGEEIRYRSVADPPDSNLQQQLVSCDNYS